MKICKRCQKEFATWVEIDGKRRNLQGRKFCIECSPFGKHNTSKYIGDHASDSERRKKWSRYDSKYTNERRRKQKIELFHYKGGKCEICGFDKPIMAAYAFHHIDPNEKTYGLAYLMRNIEMAKKEADKCMLLCVRCHAILHSKERSENNDE